MSHRTRGQSVLIGVVLLFGIVAVSAVGLFLVAGQSVENIERSSADERIQTEFVELKHGLASSLYATDTGGSATIQSGSYGDIDSEESGWMNVTTTADSSPEINISLGSIVYEGTDGSTVAYQAGGVWRGTGTETQIVSTPPVHYEDGSLSLPVTVVRGGETLHSDRKLVEHTRTTSHDEISFVRDEAVLLEITSEYYMGWTEYFATQTNEAVINELDHDENRVVVELGRTDLDNAHLDKVATASGPVTEGGGNSEVDGEYIAEGCDGDPQCTEYDVTHEVNSLDWEIEQLIDRAGTPYGDPAGETLSDGTYFVDDNITLENQDMEVDLQDGNVTLIHDGHLTLANQNISVVNGDGPDSGTFRYYSSGSIAVGQAGGINYGGNPSETELYGTSKMNVSVGQNAEISGSIYAPREETVEEKNPPATDLSNTPDCKEYDVCIDNGGGTINGAVVTGSVNLGSGDNTLQYDPDVANSQPTVRPEGIDLPPTITYLNIAEHEVEVVNG